MDAVIVKDYKAIHLVFKNKWTTATILNKIQSHKHGTEQKKPDKHVRV